jgi:transposase InsO family protein
VQDEANGASLVDLVGRDFVPPGKDQLWYGDIACIFTLAGWVYLATVIDGYSRRVVGWAVADHMREELVMIAFAIASSGCSFTTSGNHLQVRSTREIRPARPARIYAFPAVALNKS